MTRASLVRHPFPVKLVLAGLIVGLITAARGVGLLDLPDLWGYDILVAAREPCQQSPKIIIVDFDDASLDSLGTSRVPRGPLARLLERISSGEPALIGLDILLDEERGHVDDDELALQIKQAGNIILVETFAAGPLPAASPLYTTVVNL